MNQRLLSVFFFAIAVAAIASFLVYRFVSLHVQTAAPVSTAVVLVADHDLEVGALIHEGDLRKAPWFGPVPQQAIVKPEEALNRGVITKIFKDEPMVAGRLAPQGAGAGLAAIIPLGMRAVALRVNDVVGLAGFVSPGMRVDVLVAGNAPGSDQNRNGTVSRTVLQNLEVLSANQRIERNAEGKPEDAQVVNLLVTPDQAEVLNLAGSEAKVQLVLRNPLDTREQATHGTTSATLFGGVASPVMIRNVALPRPRSVSTPARVTAAPKVIAAAPMIEVFSGGKRTEQRFGGASETH